MNVKPDDPSSIIQSKDGKAESPFVKSKDVQDSSALERFRPVVETLLRVSVSYDPWNVSEPEDNDVKKSLEAFIEAATFSGWPVVLEAVERYSLAPLLFRLLQKAGPTGSVPENVSARLKMRYRASVIRSKFFRTAVLPVIQRCSERHVPIIMLKGSFLAGEIYRDPALRPMGDVDILVKKEDILEMVSILQESGFSPSQQEEYRMSVWLETLKSGRENSAMDELLIHLPPFHGAGGHVIELHYSIMLRARHPECRTEDLFARAIPFTFESAVTNALCAEDCLLHLCEHYIRQHCLGSGPKGLVDIALVIKRYRTVIDPVILYERALSWGVQRNLSLCFALCEKFVGVSMPLDPRHDAMIRSIPDTVLLEAFSLMVSESRGHSFSMGITGFYATSNPWKRLQALMSRLFLPVDRIRLIEPSVSRKGNASQPSVPELYVRRLLGLLNRHGARRILASFLARSGKSSLSATERSFLCVNEWLNR